MHLTCSQRQVLYFYNNYRRQWYKKEKNNDNHTKRNEITNGKTGVAGAKLAAF